MANLATSWTTINPSFMEPDFIVQYNQYSGAFRALAGGAPRVKIGSEDKVVYAKRLDVRAAVSANQAAGNQIQSATVVPSMIQCPTYLVRSRAEYDHHDTAMMSEWGVSVVDAERMANRQAHFQFLRNMLLYGNIPANGEGIVNANGATSVSLPADSFGNTTVLTYDNGQLGTFFLQQFLNLKAACFQLGMPARFVVLGPQRILGQMEYPNIVQLTSYQRPGAGSATTAGMIKDVAGLNGDVVEWTYDDTLIGQGAGGGSNDLVIINMPEIKKPEGPGINTNEFAKVTPSMNDCTLMYTDVAAPIEIPTPLPAGAIDVLFEMRASPGWVTRPETVRLCTIPY